MSGSLIERVRERLAAEAGPLGPSVVAAAIRAESGGMLGDTEVLANLRVLQTELTGAGILEPLLCADGTTDVLVTAPDAVWVDDGNGLRRTGLRFPDDAAVRRLAQRLALAAGRRLDDAQPWVDGELSGFGGGGFAVRLHAVLPPVAAAGTCLSLRVLRPASQDLAALIAAGAIEPAAAALVADIIAARLAFLVSGGTGAGKTTHHLRHRETDAIGVALACPRSDKCGDRDTIAIPNSSWSRRCGTCSPSWRPDRCPTLVSTDSSMSAHQTRRFSWR